MATYEFTKETGGFSIKKDALKVSYSSATKFRAYASGTKANILFPEYPQPISQIEVIIGTDTVKVNTVTFAGTATELVDALRDTVFIADVIV